MWVDEGVANGLTWVQELGTIMGNDAIGIANSISTEPESRKIAISNSAYVWPKKGSTTPTENVTVGAIRFGDTAFVGFKPELNYLTEQQLWDASPYAHTLLISFLNGDQKYMPDKDAYTWGLTGSAEAQKSGFAPGAAEQLRGTALTLLNSLKDSPSVAAPAVALLSPNLGADAGGTSVIITGTDFTDVSAVTFGGTPAASFVVNSVTQIVATAPAHAAGVVDVAVTAAGGDSDITGTADNFTYILTNAYDDKDTKITYAHDWSRWDDSGYWAASQDTYAYSDKDGSKVIVTFQGTSLSWVACTSNTKGKAQVTVDPGTSGAKTNTVDLYSAATLWKQTVYFTGILSYGTHTVVIECLGEKNPASMWYTIGVDRFDIAGTLVQSPAITKVDDKSATYFNYAPDWSHWDDSGYWAAHLDTYAYTDELADKVTFTFNGTYASWVACTSNTKGKALVTVDGNTAGAVTVDLYSPSTLWKQNVYDTGVLAPGTHTVVIECLRQKNSASAWYTIDVDRFDVILAP